MTLKRAHYEVRANGPRDTCIPTDDNRCGLFLLRQYPATVGRCKADDDFRVEAGAEDATDTGDGDNEGFGHGGGLVREWVTGN